MNNHDLSRMSGTNKQSNKHRQYRDSAFMFFLAAIGIFGTLFILALINYIK